MVFGDFPFRSQVESGCRSAKMTAAGREVRSRCAPNPVARGCKIAARREFCNHLPRDFATAWGRQNATACATTRGAILQPPAPENDPPALGQAMVRKMEAQGEGASAEVLTTFAPAPSPLGGNNCGRRFKRCSARVSQFHSPRAVRPLKTLGAHSLAPKMP